MADAAVPADRMVAGRRRVILMTAGVAALSLATGVVLAGRITSPREAAARARSPEAGTITAPVERRVVSNEVVTRGDVVYEGAADVSISTAGLDTNPVVTGQVPQVGSTVEAGQVVLQVVGRPVIALPGAVPTYRSLSPGLSGPDVLQLEAALAGFGLDPGDAADSSYDQQTAAAVAQLYARVGYAPPTAEDSLADELDAAREDLSAAEGEVLSAQQELAAALIPLPESERLAAEAAVASAERALADAQAEGDPGAIADAQAQLAVAQAQRDELLAPPDPVAEQGALALAEGRVAAVRTTLADLELRAGTPLPAAEVIFVPTLPRRVDEVLVRSGGTVAGPVLRLSGSDVVVVASLGSVDAQLVGPDLAAEIDLGDSTAPGTVVEVRDVVVAPEEGEGEDASPETTRREAVIRPEPSASEQLARLRGENVRVTVPVQSTAGEVLAVPLAALSAGPGGEARVEVRRADGRVERLDVEVGLTAAGYAEIRPSAGGLSEGDQVVVGR